MSSGGKTAATAMVDQAKALVDKARQREAQLSLLEPVTAEEMLRAREELGPEAGPLSVLDHARSKRGRKPGSRNRHTKDFAKYISQFGRDPAITLMEIQSTPTEVLVERSRLLDPDKRRLSTGDAEALRIRCAEALMPYMHGKKPVEIVADVNGDFNLLIPGINIDQADARAAADGAFVLEAEYEPVDEGKGEG